MLSAPKEPLPVRPSRVQYIQAQNAATKIAEAIRYLANCEPSARDYASPDDYAIAKAAYDVRVLLLNAVYGDMAELGERYWPRLAESEQLP